MNCLRPAITSVLLLLITAAPATAPSEFDELKQQALSEDFNVSRVALKALVAKGAPAKLVLRDVAKELLARDKTKVSENAELLADVAKYRDWDQKLAAARKSANDNIAILEREKTVKEAAANYRLVAQLWKQNAAPLRSVIYDAMKRRPELLAIWRQTPVPTAENPFAPPEEAKLIALAEKALGMTLTQANGLAAAIERNVPADLAKRNFWFYRMCRQIEAYNAGFENLLDKEEFMNVRLTNNYREALGILPLELDARLIQAARRHSKEMSDLNYFSHHSPNQSQLDFERRYLNSGYRDLGSENIAHGTGSAQLAFQVWFDSPSHHVNMVRPGNNSIGVGRWKNYWTANFGNGPRMMIASDAQRSALIVKGEILKPDVPYADKEEWRGLPGLPSELFDK